MESAAEIADRLPVNRNLPRGRHLPAHKRKQLLVAIGDVPVGETPEERRQRQRRDAKAIAAAVARGAFSQAFACILLKKLCADERPMARTINLQGELPPIEDAASYRRHLGVISAAAGEGRLTSHEARTLTQLARLSWDALKAERREAR